jgi:repressor of nif and glnA expression
LRITDLVDIHVSVNEVDVLKDIVTFLNINHDSMLTTRGVTVLHRAGVLKHGREHDGVHSERLDMTQMMST